MLNGVQMSSKLIRFLEFSNHWVRYYHCSHIKKNKCKKTANIVVSIVGEDELAVSPVISGTNVHDLECTKEPGTSVETLGVFDCKDEMREAAEKKAFALLRPFFQINQNHPPKSCMHLFQK